MCLLNHLHQRTAIAFHCLGRQGYIGAKLQPNAKEASGIGQGIRQKYTLDSMKPNMSQ
jgi:hypothetical protein